MSPEPNVAHPPERFDTDLLARVHPEDWRNPTPQGRYNLVVIGGGTAGLVTAAAGATLGAKVALIEKHHLGGDCLNVGCVPSKCLIRSGRAAHDVRMAKDFQVQAEDGVTVDFAGVMARMRRLRAGMSHNDSAQRFAELGVDVFLGRARFTGRDTVLVDDQTLRFRKTVIATGSRPVVPPVPGLAEARFHTNESIFALTEQPRKMIVLGGGPIGAELAQTFARFGTEVIVIGKAPQLLPREDPDVAAIVQRAFEREGIRLVLDAAVTRVTQEGAATTVSYEQDGCTEEVVGDTLLVAAGRRPVLDALGLDAAGVACTAEGVTVDDRLRTTNRRIYAAGDVCMRYKFTHAADAAARIVVQNALFWGRKKASRLVIPWCTYTDPEVAHVGLSAQQAGAEGVALDTLRIPFSLVDRAITDGEEDGMLVVHLHRGSDRIAGATLVARHAGEMIGELVLAMSHNIGLSALVNLIHPYPTQAEAIRKAADAYNRARLTPLVRAVLRRVLAWQR